MKSLLYTRTGDDGQTSLVGGQRIAKDSLRLEAYGTLDELSSHLGMLVSTNGVSDLVGGQLKSIQNELFNIGSYLATAVPEDARPVCPSLEDGARIQTMEGWIDALDEETPKIRAFVLPGGHIGASAAHVARTVCRRAERNILALSRQEYVDPQVLRYVNRLSDYLFAAARYINFINGVAEVTWQQDSK